MMSVYPYPLFVFAYPHLYLLILSKFLFTILKIDLKRTVLLVFFLAIELISSQQSNFLLSFFICFHVLHRRFLFWSISWSGGYRNNSNMEKINIYYQISSQRHIWQPGRWNLQQLGSAYSRRFHHLCWQEDHYERCRCYFWKLKLRLSGSVRLNWKL